MKRLQHLKVTTKKDTFDPNQHGTPVDSGGHGAHSQEDKPDEYGTPVLGDHTRNKNIDEAANLPPSSESWMKEDDNRKNYDHERPIDLSGKLHDQLPYDEYSNHDDLERYTRNSEGLNKHLYRRHTKTKDYYDQPVRHDPEMSEWAKNLDKPTRQRSIGKELHVYHGASFHPGMEAEKHKSNRLMFPSFLSTSIHKTIASSFGKNLKDPNNPSKKVKHIIHFHLDPKSKGTYIGERSRHKSELEYLIPRHTSVHINPVPDIYHTNDDKQIHVWHATDVKHHVIREPEMDAKEKEANDEYHNDKPLYHIKRNDVSKLLNLINKEDVLKPHHWNEIMNRNNPDIIRNAVNNTLQRDRPIDRQHLVYGLKNGARIPDSYSRLTPDHIDDMIYNRQISHLPHNNHHDLTTDQLDKIFKADPHTFRDHIIHAKNITPDQMTQAINRHSHVGGNEKIKGEFLDHAVDNVKDHKLGYLANNPNLNSEHITKILKKNPDSAYTLLQNPHIHDELTPNHMRSMAAYEPHEVVKHPMTQNAELHHILKTNYQITKHNVESHPNWNPDIKSEEDSPNKYGTVVDTGGHGEHAKVDKKKSLSEAIHINLLKAQPAFHDPSEPKPKRFGKWTQENDNNHLGGDHHSVESELHSKHDYHEYPHRDDISQYTSSSHDLNTYLLNRHRSRETTRHKPEIVSHAKNLDKATRFKELGHDLHTYHGTRFDPGAEAAKHPENRLYFPCFTSTSLSKIQAHGFSHVNGHDETDGRPIQHVIHFHHKENNKGAYIGKYSRHDSEKEFLVPRNTSVKINPEPTKTVDSDGNHIHIWHATDITHHAIKDGLSKTEREFAKMVKADPVYGSILKGSYDEISDHIQRGKFTSAHKDMVANNPDIDGNFKRHVFGALANKNENLTKEELANHVTSIPDHYTHLNNEKIEHIISSDKSRILGEHAANISQKHIKAILSKGYGSLPSGLIKNRRLTSDQFIQTLKRNPGAAGNLQGAKLTKAIKTADDGSSLSGALADNRHLTPEHLTHLIPKLSFYGLSDLGYNSANRDKLTKQHIDMLMNHPEGVPSGIHGNMHQFKNATDKHLNNALLKYGNIGVVKHPNFKISSTNARNILSDDYYLPDKVKQDAAKALSSADVNHLMTHGSRETKTTIMEHSDKVKSEHLMSVIEAHPWSEVLADMITKHKSYDGETALKQIKLGKVEGEDYHAEAALKSGKLSRDQLRKLDFSGHSNKLEELRKETLRKLAFKEINDKIDKERAENVTEPKEAPVEAPKEEDANSIRLHNTLDNHLKVQKAEKDKINPQPMSQEDYQHLVNHARAMDMHHITKLLKLKGYPLTKIDTIQYNPNVTREHLKMAVKDSHASVKKHALETLLKLGIK